ALPISFADHPDIRAVFVTNSRISTVAAFFEKRREGKYLDTPNKGQHPVILIGYDFLEKNIEYLEKEIIDFLICQQPDEQGYLGIRNLYQSQVLGKPVEKVHFMPIDIVARENYSVRSEEHTSELQSRENLVCRL